MIAGAAHAVTAGLVATSAQLWSDALRFARWAISTAL
jgi:hypothetical protein